MSSSVCLGWRRRCWSRRRRRREPESERLAPQRDQRLLWPSSSPRSLHRSPTLTRTKTGRRKRSYSCRAERLFTNNSSRVSLWMLGNSTHSVKWPQRTEACPSLAVRLQRDAVSSEGAPSPHLHTHAHTHNLISKKLKLQLPIISIYNENNWLLFGLQYFSKQMEL